MGPMKRADLRREVRRLLAEFTATIEEFRSASMRPGRTPSRALTYGEGMLVTCAPMLIAFANSCREDIDELDDDELVTLHRQTAPVVELRRLARANAEKRRGGS